MDIIAKFTELYLYQPIHTDNMVDFMNTIDYYKLDYTNEINVFILYYRIELFTAFIRDFNDFDGLLDILLSKSLILYNKIISNIAVEGSKYYNDIILSLVPNTKYEKIVYYLTLIYNESTLYIDDVIKNNCLQMCDNEIILIKYVQDKTNKISLHKRELEPTNLPQMTNLILYYFSTFNYIKAKECIDIIKYSKISKDYINCLEYTFEILTNENEVYNMDKLIEHYTNISINNTKYTSVLLGYKLLLLNKLTFIFIRNNNTKNINDFKEYYDKNIVLFENCKNLLYYSIIASYFGKLLKHETNVSIKLQYCKNIINSLEQYIYLRKNFNHIIDLMRMYNLMKSQDKSYQIKLNELYESNKDFILKNKESNLFIVFVNLISQVLIDSHQIKLLKELRTSIVYDENNSSNLIKKEFSLHKKIIQNFNNTDYIIKTIGFNIVDSCDVSCDNPKCMRNEDDKIVCPICYDTIEDNKITMIECLKCNKYIGHYMCVQKYIKTKITEHKQEIHCISCREPYVIDRTLIMNGMEK